MTDKVELILNGEEILIAKEYTVEIAVMMCPSTFSIGIGTGTSALSLMRRFPARTPFVLRINGLVQFAGLTDGFERPDGEHTELRITGRDCMAPLLRNSIIHDRTFSSATFEDLARAAIVGAGYKNYNLTFDDRAQRHAVTGTPIVESKVIKEKQYINLNDLRVLDTTGVPQGADLNYQPLDYDPTYYVDKTITKITGYKTEKPIEWKAGTKWYAAAKKEFDRAGLFLRGGVDPQGKQPNVFLLSEPSAAQQPIYGLICTRDPISANNVVNVRPPHITDLTTNLCARYIVRGRAGGGKAGTKQIEAYFDDEDMIALGYDPNVDVDVVVDELARSTAQARYIARRRCAEMRRQHRVFTYRMPNRHSAPSLYNPSSQIVLAPDTVTSLLDEENGMEGPFWIERVKHNGSASGPTGTDITIMVPDDLVFGDGEFLSNATRKVSGRKWGKK